MSKTEYVQAEHDPANLKRIEKCLKDLRKLLDKEGLMLMAGTGLSVIETRGYNGMQDNGNRIPLEAAIMHYKTFPCDGGDPW